ncbi:hypothetical protein [Paenarthrobacter sp. NPDC018779]|uniref:hypothetical protein n=1 Tax=Paenarthrobacter sp. NPDC018779 TaxID=3364375 RepID=UPI0037CB1BBB
MKIPLVMRPFRLILTFIAVILIAISSFILGSSLKNAEDSIIDAANIVVPVTATAELRTVSHSAKVQGIVTPGTVVDVPAPLLEGQGPPVITQLFSGIGEDVKSGSILGTVSGRPLIMVNSDVPLYRDLHQGDTGPDVRALQREFESWGYFPGNTGILDEATINAFQRIYRVMKVDPPIDGKTVYIRFQEFFHIAGNTGTITELRPIGESVDKEHPVARIKTSPDVVSARASLSVSDSFPPGTPVVFKLPGTKVESTVLSVSSFVDGDGTKPAGIDVIMALPEGTTLGLGVPVLVGTVAPETTGVAVPVTAIREDDSGLYVLIDDDLTSGTPSRQPPKRVEISVQAQDDGWAVLAPNDKVREGIHVVVSP